MDPDLFDRIPPEVWAKVFRNLENDHSSLYSCYTALECASGHALLSEDKTRFLFPLIISSLSEELDTKDLLTLRSVSKTWKSAVENLLEETASWNSGAAPSTKSYRNVHTLEPEDVWFKNTLGTTFSHPSHIDEFMRQMEGCTGNPFLNRTVKIVYNRDIGRSPGMLGRLHRNFTRLIEKYGEHIWTCVYLTFADIPECNRQQQYLFQHLRNIRCLTIISSNGNEYDANNPYGYDYYEELEDSTLWMDDIRHLPPLEHLKSLNLFYDAPLISDLLLNRYGSQLHSLELSSHLISMCPFFNEVPTQRQGLENLRALKIFTVLGPSYKVLERISTFQLPHLERVYLNYRELKGVPSDSAFSAFQTVFQFINEFSPTLKELLMPIGFLNLEDEDNYQQDKDGGAAFERDLLNAELPLVKMISISLSHLKYSLFNAGIISKFPNLEHLHVVIDEKLDQSEELRTTYLREQMVLFWETISTLKKITVEYFCTNNIIFQSNRELYEFQRSLVDPRD